MSKHSFLTPKAVANKIKSKGLQKLQWYCQMCEKQCRDENDFKCHTMSESHQRQLLLFAENSDKHINNLSQEFLNGFIDFLRRRFGNRRVPANQVYREYIADPDHLHMNVTKWETLTDFVKWLGKNGRCIVDENKKDWFIAYIDKDPGTLLREEAFLKSQKIKRDDEKRMAKLLQKQMEKDLAKSKPVPEPVYTELKKRKDEKVTFSLKMTKLKPTFNTVQNPLCALKSDSDSGGQEETKSTEKAKKRKSAFAETDEMEISIMEKKNRNDYWLAPDIVVNIITKKYGNEFYRKKAVVKKVENFYTGYVKVIDSREKLIVDQKDLETVIPGVGRRLLIVNGAFRESVAEVLEVNMENFCVKVKIVAGVYKDRIIDSISYTDVCKLYVNHRYL